MLPLQSIATVAALMQFFTWNPHPLKLHGCQLSLHLLHGIQVSFVCHELVQLCCLGLPAKHEAKNVQFPWGD